MKPTNLKDRCCGYPALVGIVLFCLAAIAPAQQIRQGDWIVAGPETVRNASIVLRGNLVVQRTGNLTLENVTLSIECQTLPCGIKANAGSRLTITGSTIKPGAGAPRYIFVVDGATFALRNTRVEGVARYTQIPNQEGLLLLGTTDAVLQENTFPDPEFVAMTLMSSRRARITGNTFGHEDDAGIISVILTNSDENVMSKNRLLRAGFVLRASHNNQIVDNDLTTGNMSGGAALYLGSAYNLVARNRVVHPAGSPNSCWAFTSIGNQQPNWFLDNYMEGFRYGVMTSYTSNAVIAGNRFVRMTENNTLANIHLHHSRNIKVLNNEITGMNPGILLFGTSQSEVRGNSVDGASWGVALYHSDANTISGNVLARNGDNLVLRDSKDNLIEGNDFFLWKRQAVVESPNTFRGNYFDDAPAGMNVYPLAPQGEDRSPTAVAHGVTLAAVPHYAAGASTARATATTAVLEKEELWENCDRELGPGIMVINGGRLTIRNCTVRASSTWAEDRAALLSAGPGGTLEILYSTFANDGFSAPYTIASYSGGKLVIRDSRIINVGSSTNGIDLHGDGAVIENNEISGAWLGIRIAASGGHRIVGNQISKVLNHGIFGGGPPGQNHDVVIEDNTISQVVWEGFGIHGLNGSRIANNRVYRGALALASAGEGNKIRGNTFIDGVQAMNLWGGANTIEANSFLANGRTRIYHHDGGQPGPAPNAIGNYWSDYRGGDSNGDGAGDVPYEPGGDPAPLMTPPSAAPSVLLSGVTETWVPSQGGRFTLPLTRSDPAASSPDGWIRASAGGADLEFEVSSNPEAAVRAGSVIVGGQPLRIYQSPSGCVYNVAPASAKIDYRGGTAEFSVSAPAGCSWTVEPESWLALEPGGRTVGAGNGIVRVVAPNNPYPERATRVRIGDRYLEVLQGSGPVVVREGAVVNAASFLYGAGMAPGAYVALFGKRLTAGDTAIAAGLQQTLAGVSLTVAGIPASIVYASPGQINFLVPSGVPAGKQETHYHLEGAGPGAMLAFDVVPAAPGIFTLNGSGSGQAVVVNQDQSFNSASNAAARGSIVTFFVTGTGATNPPMEEGKHPTPPLFPAPALPLTVLFGGQPVAPVDVQFAGMTYQGVLQVNVRIPETAPTGSDVALTLRLAGDGGKNYDSQPGVTLAVR